MKIAAYFILSMLLLSECFSQNQFNPKLPVDTILIKRTDITGDGIPEKITLRLKAKDFYTPLWWQLSIISKGKVIYSYTESDSSAEFKFIDDPERAKQYLKLKYHYFYKEFVGLQISKSINFGGRDGKKSLLSKTYDGSIYKIARKYLVDQYHLNANAADNAIERVAKLIATGQTVIILHDCGNVETTLPMVYFKEVNALVPIFSD